MLRASLQSPSAAAVKSSVGNSAEIAAEIATEPRAQTVASGQAGSIGERIIDTGGRSCGFDYLRLGLAVAVVLMHGVVVSRGRGAEDELLWLSWLRPYVRLILPMFFALSGFLVAGSLSRCKTLGPFLGLRAIRIYPALCVEVLLSALLLGPLLTTASMSAYFGDRMFWHYLLNVVGHIHYLLPGVFAGNPYPDVVNAQLWTIPYELYCYLVLGALGLAGLLKHRLLAPLAAALIAAVTMAVQVFGSPAERGLAVGPLAGSLLIVSFLAGVSIWLYRDRLPRNAAMLILSAVASVALVGRIPGGDALAPFPIAYLTVLVGLCNPRPMVLLKGADYSYGIYLYGFAIQQALAAAGVRTPLLNGLLSVGIATAFAALSWHWVEKPALRMRHWFVHAEPPGRPVRSVTGRG